MKNFTLEKLPFLSHLPKDGRGIPIMPIFEHPSTWRLFIEKQDGTFLEIHPIQGVAIQYLSKTPRNSQLDNFSPLRNMITQCFSFPDTMRILDAIEHDFKNALASLHKYFILLKSMNNSDHCCAQTLMSTEIEFAVLNHRSFYDLLNRLFVSIYKRLDIRDSMGKRVKPNNVPDSFHKLVEKSDDDLAKAFHFPRPIIEFIRSKESVFRCLLSVRDNIVHHGHTPDFSYTMPDGFALPLDEKMWKGIRNLNLWPEGSMKNNRLASVLPLLAFLVEDMDSAMNTMAEGLERSFEKLPQAVAAEYKVYSVDPLFLYAKKIVDFKKEHWFDPAVVLAESQRVWSESETSGPTSANHKT